jgi:hypothetical protein
LAAFTRAPLRGRGGKESERFLKDRGRWRRVPFNGLKPETVTTNNNAIRPARRAKKKNDHEIQ